MKLAYHETLFQAELAILCSHRNTTLTVLHLFRDSAGSRLEQNNVAKRLLLTGDWTPAFAGELLMRYKRFRSNTPPKTRKLRGLRQSGQR